MIELDHEQLIYLRNTLTWLKQYVPYQERGDMPFHAIVWYPCLLYTSPSPRD